MRWKHAKGILSGKCCICYGGVPVVLGGLQVRSIMEIWNRHAAPPAPSPVEEQDIFTLLNDYCHQNKVRLLELFREYDKDRSGGLEPTELRKMVKLLLPNATQKQLRYLQVILDANGDGVISYKEFVRLVHDCKATGLRVYAQENVEGADVMKRLSTEVKLNEGRARAVFKQFDIDHDGQLDKAEQLKMVKRLLPALTSREMHAVVASLNAHNLDPAGRLSFLEMIKGIHKVPGRDKRRSFSNLVL
eukprot:jgi/Mesvir1/8173/Mv12477-RA.1